MDNEKLKALLLYNVVIFFLNNSSLFLWNIPQLSLVKYSDISLLLANDFGEIKVVHSGMSGISMLNVLSSSYSLISVTSGIPP